MGLRFGRYETIQPIASGGMATVYLGRARGAGGFERRVAIKVMHEHVADELDFEAMFLDEARLAARIHHPNVVSTIDVQKTEEAMFLVMEYVEGASLKRVLRELGQRGDVMPLGVVILVMMDALAGLHAAHELLDDEDRPLDLIHRDISPHNILVGTDGITRITDFGVARAAARLGSTGAGTLKGKIAYMPPEQGRGDDIDRRADIYSAGVVLWELLTGRRLFDAEHDGQLVALILNGPEMSPAEVVPSLPETINRVCMKALSIDPNRRFATAEQFADALEAAAHAADVRIAKPSKVSAFVAEFKVPVERSFGSDGDDPVPRASPSGSGAREPSVPTGTSQLSVVGAVRSQKPPATASRRRRWAVVIGAGGLVALTTIVWMIARPGEVTAPPAAAAGDGVAPAPTFSPTAGVASAVPSVEAAVAPVPSASATAEEPPARGKRRAAPRPRTKPKTKSPLGFEPNTL
jgi:serine/threonine-protein kinase